MTTENGMTLQPAIIKSVDISAPTKEVWQALTEQEKIRQWMAGAQVQSTWKPGSEITFSGTMPNFNIPYQDHGTILVIEHEKLLQYDLWSQASRRPDLPENRTRITLTLEQTDEITRLTVYHEGFQSEVEYKHVNFFWTGALYTIKNLSEQKMTERKYTDDI